MHSTVLFATKPSTSGERVIFSQPSCGLLEQLAADAGLADYNRIQERKAHEEKERLDKLAARRRQEAEEAAAASLRAMYIIEGATTDEIRIVDNLMRRAGKYGDVVAHQAKLQNLRWTMEG